MKKTLSLVLALLLFVSVFCGCAKDSNSETSKTSTTDEVSTTAPATAENVAPEEIVKMYMDNADVWANDSEGIDWFGYLFLDLDFDGVLELVYTTCMGTGFYSYNKYYKLDTDTKTVSEIPFPDVVEDMQCDYTGIDYPQLYKNNSTGELKYMMYDNARDGLFRHTTHLSELFLDENGNVSVNYLWSFDYTADEDNTNGTFTYTNYENNVAKEVDEETYDKTINQYETDNTNLNLQFKTIAGHGTIETEYSNFAELDYDAQYELLLESYNAFSHD